MANPFDQFDTSPHTGPIYGAPQKQDIPSGYAGDNGGLNYIPGGPADPRTKVPTPQTPEQRSSTVVGTQRTQQDISFDRAKVGSQLGESFRNDPAVKAYREVLPQVAMAEQAQRNGAGDTSVVYAWAKAMDPMGSVREGDVQTAQGAVGPVQRAKFLVSKYRLETGGTLPPKIRDGLIGEMRNKQGQLNHQYSAVHQHYLQLAQQNGVDPATIGEHEGAMYRATEEQYIKEHGGTPRDPNAPQPQGQASPPSSSGKYQVRAPDGHVYEFDAPQNATPQQLDDLARKAAGFAKNYPIVENTINDAAGIAQGAAALPDAAAMAAGKVMSVIPTALGAGADALGFDKAGQYLHDVAHDLANPMQIGDAVERVAPTPNSTGGKVNRFVGQMVGGAVGMPASAIENTVARIVGEVPKGFKAAAPAARGITADTERATMRQKQLDAAAGAKDLGIQMPRFVAGGPTAQKLGALADQSQIGAPIIRRSTNAMLDQSEAARNSIASATGGKAMNNEGMGASAITGAQKARIALKSNYGRVYGVAESLSGDTRVPLPTAKQEALAQLAELKDTPGGMQPAIASTLEDIAAKMDGEWTPAGVRRMRTQLRQRFVDSGFDHGDASRIAQRIATAAENDMVSGLRAANKGDAATAWQRASQMRASYQTAVDETLSPILGINKEKTGPEVARALHSAVKNNPGQFRQFMALLPPEEASNVKASIIGQMGNPGTGGQDVAGEAFSLGKFLTHWNDIKDVRNQVFDPITIKALNKLAQVAERAKQAGHVENHSNTGSISIAVMTAGPISTAPVALLSGHPGAAAAAVATSAVLAAIQAAGAKLLASPRYAQTLASLAQAAETGNPNAVRSQIGRLSKLAASNPAMRGPIKELISRLANDNAPRMGAASASPNGRPDQEQQPQR